MSMYDSHTAKFLSAVAQGMPKDMPGEIMQGWIDNPKGLQRVLREALCPPPNIGSGEVPRKPNFKIWKTIEVGTGLKTASEFAVAIEQAGCRVSDYAKGLMGRKEFTVVSQLAKVDLVCVSNADLGRPDGCTRRETYELALAAGLLKCEPEDGPQLRRQYTDQPKGEWLLIASDPIAGSDGGLRLLGVRHGVSGRWLDGRSAGHPDDHWVGDARWVFRLPQVSSGT